MKTLIELYDLIPLFVAAAQKEYDEWEQDDEGIDSMLGSGGLCQNIANALASVAWEHGFECTLVSAEIGEQHVWIVVQTDDGVYSVDIPPYVYETGGGYTWKKIPNVKFTSNDIEIDHISPDPDDFSEFEE